MAQAPWGQAIRDGYLCRTHGRLYTIPMNYVNVRGFGAPTLAPALRLLGDYGPGAGGAGLQESEAGLSGHSLLTLFPLCAKRGAERPQVSDQSAGTRREESRGGAATSGVRRGA